MQVPRPHLPGIQSQVLGCISKGSMGDSTELEAGFVGRGKQGGRRRRRGAVAREGPGGRRAGRAGGAGRGGTAGDQCSRPQFHRFMGQSLLRPSHFPTREPESHSKFTRLTPGRAEREPGRGPASKAGALSAELTLESPLPLAVLGARAAAKHRTHTLVPGVA